MLGTIEITGARMGSNLNILHVPKQRTYHPSFPGLTGESRNSLHTGPAYSNLTIVLVTLLFDVSNCRK
jgi:hypothetical protein